MPVAGTLPRHSRSRSRRFQVRLADEVEGKVNPFPIVIHDCSLLEGADGRAPRRRQRLVQIFAAESGDFHFVQRGPIETFVLAVQSKIQQVVVWEKAKVTIDPKPAVGNRQTEDFLPLRHEPHRPPGGDAVLHHRHSGEEIVAGSRGLKVRQQHNHHRVPRNRIIDSSEIGVHIHRAHSSHVVLPFHSGHFTR